MIVSTLGAEVPVIQTVFSPLSQAKNLVGKDNLAVHVRKYPEQLKAGLKTIAESIQRFLEAIRGTGVDGIFYAVQHAQYGLYSEQEYAEFGTVFDNYALEPIEQFKNNMLHLHGREAIFDRFLDYPFAIMIVNLHLHWRKPSRNTLARYVVACAGKRQCFRNSRRRQSRSAGCYPPDWRARIDPGNRLCYADHCSAQQYFCSPPEC